MRPVMKRGDSHSEIAAKTRSFQDHLDGIAERKKQTSTAWRAVAHMLVGALGIAQLATGADNLGSDSCPAEER